MFGRLLAQTEREDLRGRLRYLTCRALGHRIRFDGSEYWCIRCGDVMPLGNDSRQP